MPKTTALDVLIAAMQEADEKVGHDDLLLFAAHTANAWTKKGWMLVSIEEAGNDLRS